MSPPTTRREFLKVSATAGLGLAVLPAWVRAGGASSPNDTVRLAVIGTNNRGLDHIDSLAGIAHTQIAYVCDVEDGALAKGVQRAVENVNTEICEAVLDLDGTEQGLVDRTLISLDGTDNKSRLGANALLAVSCAVAKAAAEECSLPLYRYLGGAGEMQLPVPMMNVINGGAHANNSIDMQEFMIVPAGAQSFREALRCGSEVFQALKKLIDGRGLSTAVGDEGGFAPSLATHAAAIELILEAIERAGYTAGSDVLLALDCAATEFFHDGVYKLEGEGKQFDAAGMDPRAGDKRPHVVFVTAEKEYESHKTLPAFAARLGFAFVGLFRSAKAIVDANEKGTAPASPSTTAG